MKMRKMFAFLLAASFCGALWSNESSLTVKGVADFSGAAGKLKNIPGGVAFTNGAGYWQAVSKKKLPIDLKKKYLISLEYRLAPGGNPGCGFYFAPIAYDSKGTLINCESQRIIPGTV